MFGIERRQKIAEILQKEDKVYVAALSVLFEVTEETVRRDLDKLEQEGIVTRTHGGAVLNRHTNEDLPYVTRTSINQNSKLKMAALVAAMIQNGDTLMVDASSSCMEVVNALTSKSNVTIITNSVRIPYEFNNSQFYIISTGGVLRGNSFAFIGPSAQTNIENYFVDTAIMSCKGLTFDKGILESNEPESEIKRLMIKQAERVILLADSTKFGKTAFMKMFDFDMIDTLVTDEDPGKEWVEFLATRQVSLLYPGHDKK